MSEADADQASPPTGVLAKQGQGSIIKVLGGLGAWSIGVAVARCQHDRVVLAKPVQEVADRADRQVEGVCDGGGRLTALVASPDGLTMRRGNRCWHGEVRALEEGPKFGGQQSVLPGNGKT